MDPLIIKAVVACLPVVACLAVFVAMDVFKLMKAFEIAELLAGGGALAAAAYAANGGVMDLFPIKFDLYTQLGAPVVEETLKALLVVGLFAFNRVGYLVDAAITGFAIGAGFSLVENLFFLRHFADANMGVWLVRGFGTAIMHGGATAIMAALSQLLFAPRLRLQADRFRFNPLLFLPGLACAIALHAGFNHFGHAPVAAMAAIAGAVPAGLFGIFAIGETYAHRWLAQDEAAHLKLLADMNSGAFAATTEGKAIGALADRLGPEAQHLHEYVRIHVELVVRAEATLLAYEAHEAAALDTAIRTSFERLHDLEKSLGRAVVMAVRQHLKFSRNDLWELHELEEDTHGKLAAPKG
jgi:RsiW-degrading membrane proteinase PrsW (M82 family)